MIQVPRQRVGCGREGLLSIVIPISERHDDLVELCREYGSGLARWSGDREWIFVIDGDFPQAAAQVAALTEVLEEVQVVQLPRTFGEATALTVGFEVSNGEHILTLPAYGQVEPGDLERVLDAADDHDLVVGRRWPRADAAVNRLQSAAFHAIVRLITKSRFHDLGCGVRLLRRIVANEVHLYGDQHRFLPLLAQQRGFRVAEVAMRQSVRDHSARVYGPGVYSRRLLDLLTVFFLVKFTRKPLRFFGLIGVTLLVLGGAALTWVVVDRIFFDVALADRPALLLSTLFVVLGAQILALGLIGELIIFTHASELKEYTIDRIVEKQLARFPDASETDGSTAAEVAATRIAR